MLDLLGGRLARLRISAFLGAAALSLAACAGPSISAPPDAVGPDVVLRTYLEALVRGDCPAGRVLAVESFRFGDGELCGHTTVSSFTIAGSPAEPNATEVVFATILVTTGTADGSIEPGTLTWFYDLQRQPSGAWRLSGGGSGP